MISIRKRLTAMIFASLALCIFLVSSLTLFYLYEEISEVMDGELKYLATSVASFDTVSDDYITFPDDELREETDVLIQMWKQGELVYSSYPKIEMPLMDPGYGNFLWDDERLRYFHYEHNGRVVQIAQSLDEWQDIAAEISGNIMWSIILVFPFVIVLVFWIVGVGLRPLTTISHKVQERDAQNLKPIDVSHAPKEVLPVISSLNQLLARLDQSLTLQRQFTADAAHELRTPLTAIKLNLDMMQRTKEKNERAQIEQSLEAGVDRAIHLAQSLLLLARHETDAQSVEMEEIDMAAIAQKVMNGLEGFAQEKGQEISLKLPKEQTVMIRAQDHNIFVMIENLLQNAILYTPKEGRIEMALEVKNNQAIFTIADNGPGIKPEERERVFDRFYRCLGTEQQGSGLGLSIIKNIVNYYQGDIKLEDGLDHKGCKFTIFFPIL